MRFFSLEMPYIVIAIFILSITLFVTTRPFVGKNAFKIGFPTMFVIVSIMILAHYYVTTQRMQIVQKAFMEGKTIACESRENRKAAQSILINKKGNWILEDDLFKSDEYTRDFHSARCLVHIVNTNSK